MKKNNSIIVTSELDENYFIIANSEIYITELIQLFNKKGKDITNEFMPVIKNPKLINKKIFIAKDSDIGIVLKKLIEEGELVDEKDIIRESYLYNALALAIIDENGDSYIDFITSLIKTNRLGTIDSITNSLGIDVINILRKISYDGRKNNYFNKNEITGFEKEGITYEDEEWITKNLNRNSSLNRM